MIRRIVAIHFSPIGGTARMTEMLTGQLADRLRQFSSESITTESYELLHMGDVTVDLDDETVAVIGMPVYVGKLPLPAVHALRKFGANGAAALMAVSYGARTYGNALYELQHYAESQGFKVVGAGAFAVKKERDRASKSAKHSGDIRTLTEFGEAAAAKLVRLSGSEIEGLKIKPAPLEIDGHLPVHRISKLSPKAAALAQELLERVCLKRKESEWYL